MLSTAGIEQLYLSPRRPTRGTPAVSARLQRLVNRYGPVLPILVRQTEPQRFEIMGNAETWIAAQRAGFHEVPIVVREGASDAEVDALLSMHAPESPMARARRYERRLAKMPGGKGYGDIAALARKEQCSRSHIAHHLRLLTLSPLVQEAIEEGLLNVGQGKALASCQSMQGQMRLAASAITGRWSVRQTEAAVRGESEAPSDAEHIQRLERALSTHMGSPVMLNSDRGHLIIDYRKDLDVLQGVLDKLGWVEGAQ